MTIDEELAQAKEAIARKRMLNIRMNQWVMCTAVAALMGFKRALLKEEDTGGRAEVLAELDEAIEALQAGSVVGD